MKTDLGDTKLREISIILPCLNEAETIKTCISKAKKSLLQLCLDGEILVADNGSNDGSVQIAEQLGVRVVHVSKKGYGNTLRGGIEAAEGKWIIMGDADNSYDFGCIAPFIEKLREGYDLVMGCRLPKGGGKILKGAMPWKHRWLGNPSLSWIGRFFFKSPVTDFHCGMRGFTREAFQKLELKTTGMEFASEMVIKATLKGMRITEVPITLYKDGRSRPPHLRSWRDGWRHLRFMLLFSPTWLFQIPGMFLFLVGGVFGILLTRGPLVVGSLGFDTNTLLICAMWVVTGIQIFFFGILTRGFAMAEGLLPKSGYIETLLKIFTLERGLLLGLMIFLMGLLKLIYAVLYWKLAGFGVIPHAESLRMVIPAVTLIMVGVQTIFSSFFLSIVDLPRR